MHTELVNKSFQILYWIAYRIILLRNFVINPEGYGVYVAVWVNNKILVIKNSYKPYYTLPCGGINKNEMPEQAAIRELFEEVSIKAKINDLKLAGCYISHVENMKDNIRLYELILNNTPDFRVDNREVTHAEFLTPEAALQYSLFPVVRNYLISKK